QRAAHLLEHDGELDGAEPLPAELLRNDQALQTQLLGHAGPDRRIEAALALHLVANGRLRGMRLDEPPDHVAERFLLLGEREDRARRHLGSPSVRSAAMLRWISSVPP